MKKAQLNGQEIVAALSAPRKAYCYGCNEPVFLRCPLVIVPHWVHHANSKCVHACTTGPETSWHKDWKATVPEQYREKSIRRNGKLRRADILAATKTVIELQHSNISTDEVASREEFYGNNMFWMFDADGRRRVFSRYSETYVTPMVFGMTVYRCQIFEQIPGLYDAKRAKLIDMNTEVVRVIPYHGNDCRQFLCHIQDAGVVRNHVSATCGDQTPVVHPFLLNVSPEWATKRMLKNTKRAVATSSGKYMSDYCPRGYMPQTKNVEHLSSDAWAWIMNEDT